MLGEIRESSYPTIVRILCIVQGVTLAYHGTELLERTTIRLGHGRRYGLIGSNGVGKTTLLRRIAAGAVPGWPLHMRSYLVQQEEMVSVNCVSDHIWCKARNWIDAAGGEEVLLGV